MATRRVGRSRRLRVLSFADVVPGATRRCWPLLQPAAAADAQAALAAAAIDDEDDAAARTANRNDPADAQARC